MMKTINNAINLKGGFTYALLLVLIFGVGTNSVFAQDSISVLYVPLIGLTSVPDPLALPKGPGNVTYNYAVKNFLPDIALTGIQVVDDKCSPVKFVTGDDNRDTSLNYSETWRYRCTTRLSDTTQSIATAIGQANNITATHKAYATVVVGSDNLPPLVSIVNITKVAYPLSLPAAGRNIAFTYKVNNPGIVPLSDVTVTDDKCTAMSNKLGDTNGNNLLDITEVWMYTCSMHLTQTTTNTASVTAFANGLKAVADTTFTVKVDVPIGLISQQKPSQAVQSPPNLPDTGAVNPGLKSAVWVILTGVLATLIFFSVITRKRTLEKDLNEPTSMV